MPRTRTLSTFCVLDCPDTCSLEVTVRDGAIESIGPGEGGDPSPVPGSKSARVPVTRPVNPREAR